MQNRGTAFNEWSDTDLDAMRHSEVVAGGIHIEVQSRLSLEVSTQLFIGIYAQDGQRLHEHYFHHREGEHLSQAQEWGIRHARLIARGIQARVIEPSL